jgi:multiple sugar transport system permease protein
MIVEKRITPYVLVAPAVIALLLTIGYPIGYNIYISVFNWRMLESATPQNFVGLGNYFRFFKNPELLHSFFLTLQYAFFGVVLEFFLGLVIALVLFEGTYALKAFRLLLLAPIMATPLVVGLIWKVMWHAEFGVVNYFLSLFGQSKIAWLAHPRTAFASIVVVEVWQYTPFIFLIIFAGLQVLPTEPYEAATIDGASYWNKLFRITLPLIRGPILVAVVFRTIFTLRVFDQIYALTRGGPNDATMVMSLLIYREGFARWRPGYGAAMSIILLMLTAVITLALIRAIYKKNEL